jgi:hypothetical protein
MKTEKVGLTISSYEGEYVLFVNGRIVDKDHDIQRLIRRALKKYKPEENLYNECGEGKGARHNQVLSAGLMRRTNARPTLLVFSL